MKTWTCLKGAGIFYFFVTVSSSQKKAFMAQLLYSIQFVQVFVLCCIRSQYKLDVQINHSRPIMDRTTY